MTQAEDAELQRLEVNIQRLVGIVAEQNEKIPPPHPPPQRGPPPRQSAVDEPGGGRRQEARKLLDGIISQLDRCISQLATEPETIHESESEIK